MEPASRPPTLSLAPVVPRRPVGIYIWAGLIGLAACLEALAALMLFGDSHTAYERPTDRTLALFQLGGAGCALMAMLAAIFWWKMSRGSVLALLLLAAGVHLVALRANLASIADAAHRGGDWGALGVLVLQIFFVMECGIAILCLLTAVHLYRPTMRDAFAQRAGGVG